MKGSAPLLLALLLGFLALFWWQRGHSDFLAIEAEAPALAELGRRHGLDRATVMTLRELLGRDRPLPAFETACAEFAERRARIGEPLAAVAVAGEPELAQAAFTRGDGDAARAWARFRAEPRAAAGERFLAVRERFAARSAGRD